MKALALKGLFIGKKSRDSLLFRLFSMHQCKEGCLSKCSNTFLLLLECACVSKFVDIMLLAKIFILTAL